MAGPYPAAAEGEPDRLVARQIGKSGTMTDPQDRAEALDDDVLPAEYPPYQPVGVDEPEVTPQGESTRESFAEREERMEDEPDVDAVLVQPYSEVSEDVLDDESQAVAEANPEARDPASDSAPPAAEEAAMHIEERS